MGLHTFFHLAEDHKYFLLFKQGNEHGLNYLEKRLRKEVFRYARNIIANDFEIDSIIQDAFIKAWDHRAHINDISHLLNYLKQYTKWACYDWYRKNKSYLITPIELYDYQLTNIDEDSIVTDQQISKQLKWELIEKAITSLPSDKRAIAELWKTGLSYRDIAKVRSSTYQYIAAEIGKIKELLKRIINRLEKAAIAEAKRPPLILTDYKIYLNDLQSRIFKLYYEEACSLQQIIELVHLSPFKLQEQMLYIRQIIDEKPQII